MTFAYILCFVFCFFFQAEDGIRDAHEGLEFRRVLFRSALAVAEYLHFDMARVLDIAFDVQAAITEVALAFTARAFDLGVEHRQITDDAHALAAAAGARLDQQRQRDFSRTRIERSEEHTSELQSLMRISSAVFFWKKKKTYDKLI